MFLPHDEREHCVRLKQIFVNENWQNVGTPWEDLIIKSVEIQTPATLKRGFVVLDAESVLLTFWYLQVDLLQQIMHASF